MSDWRCKYILAHALSVVLLLPSLDMPRQVFQNWLQSSLYNSFNSLIHNNNCKHLNNCVGAYHNKTGGFHIGGVMCAEETTDIPHILCACRGNLVKCYLFHLYVYMNHAYLKSLCYYNGQAMGWTTTLRFPEAVGSWSFLLCQGQFRGPSSLLRYGYQGLILRGKAAGVWN
jgi:hypothetical protein